VGERGGLALLRLVLQLVPDPLVRWALAGPAVVLFVWSVAAYLEHARETRGARHFALAWLAGLALDSCLLGLWRTLDYVWADGWEALAAAVLLALGTLAALWVAAGRAAPAAQGASWRAALPLAAFGPALALHTIVWQNLGWQTVARAGTPGDAWVLVMLANLAGLLVAILAGSVRGERAAGWLAASGAVAVLAAGAGSANYSVSSAVGPRGPGAAAGAVRGERGANRR
jgi:hypothetical protein